MALAARADGFECGGVSGIARLGEGFARDGQLSCSGRGDGAGCGCCVHGDDADDERSIEPGGQFLAGGYGFERSFGEGCAGFVCMGEYENRFHYYFNPSGAKAPFLN